MHWMICQEAGHAKGLRANIERTLLWNRFSLY